MALRAASSGQHAQTHLGQPQLVVALRRRNRKAFGARLDDRRLEGLLMVGLGLDFEFAVDHFHPLAEPLQSLDPTFELLNF